jgi:hypothetical protein
MKYEVAMDLAKTFAQDALAEFVPVRGVVHLVTDMGVFLTVQGQRVFVAALSMQTPKRIPQPGEAVTLHVSRPYAEQQGFVA